MLGFVAHTGMFKRWSYQFQEIGTHGVYTCPVFFGRRNQPIARLVPLLSVMKTLLFLSSFFSKRQKAREKKKIFYVKHNAARNHKAQQYKKLEIEVGGVVVGK